MFNAGQEAMVGVVFISTPHFLRQGLSLNLELTDELDSLATLSGDLPVSASPMLITCLPPHLAFYVSFGDLNSAPQACKANTLLIKQYPDPSLPYF